MASRFHQPVDCCYGNHPTCDLSSYVNAHPGTQTGTHLTCTILCTFLLVAKIAGIVLDCLSVPCMVYDVQWNDFTSSCRVSLRTVVRRGDMYVRLQKCDATDPIGSNNSVIAYSFEKWGEIPK